MALGLAGRLLNRLTGILLLWMSFADNGLLGGYRRSITPDKMNAASLCWDACCEVICWETADVVRESR